MGQNLTANAIVAMYDLGLDPAAIAEDRGLDEAIVRTVLKAHSPEYCAANKETEDIPDDVYAQINKAMIDTALHSEDERLRMRLCMRLKDEKKGRLDRGKTVVAYLPVIEEVNRRFAAMKQARQTAIEVSAT